MSDFFPSSTLLSIGPQVSSHAGSAYFDLLARLGLEEFDDGFR